MMKTLDQIWQEYNNQGSLSERTLKDLIWYIENDTTSESVVMATDMIVDKPHNVMLNKLIPYIVKQLDHEDEYVRELAVSSIVDRIKLSEYATKALNMAKNDPYDNVRDLATSSLGAIINNVDFVLGKQIAIYLHEVIINEIYDDLRKQCAYRSVLKAMNVPVNLWPTKKINPDIHAMLDKNLLEQFKSKYDINDAA